MIHKARRKSRKRTGRRKEELKKTTEKIKKTNGKEKLLM
jgi:hypothetical protein